MSVTAIVVNYGTWDLVHGLVRLLQEDPAVREILVVDNSPDDNPMGSRDLPNLVRYTANRDNVGFAAAVNQGARLSTNRYVALINPDVRPMATCLSRLHETARAYEAALVGPRFYWDEQRTFRLPPATGGCLWWEAALQWAGTHRLEAQTLQRYWALRHEAFWAASSPFPEAFLSGALLLVDREVLTLPDGGILDERFFLYYEDTDLCARAMLSGRPLLCDPRAEAVHYWNQSPADEGHKRRLMGQSQSLFYRKYYGTVPMPLPVPSPEAGNDLPCASPPLIDLGRVAEPPCFVTAPFPHGDRLYLEFAVSPLFIPFAQASISEPSVRLPRRLWERLAPGTYYCRIRDPLMGPVGLWKWTKAGGIA